MFWLMPTRIKLKAFGAMFTGKGPKAVVQPAVADPKEMGYSGFYATILSNVSHLVYRACLVTAERQMSAMPCTQPECAACTSLPSLISTKGSGPRLLSQNNCTGRCCHRFSWSCFTCFKRTLSFARSSAWLSVCQKLNHTNFRQCQVYLAPTCFALTEQVSDSYCIADSDEGRELSCCDSLHTWQGPDWGHRHVAAAVMQCSY